jgi:hypothetical protein
MEYSLALQPLRHLTLGLDANLKLNIFCCLKVSPNPLNLSFPTKTDKLRDESSTVLPGSTFRRKDKVGHKWTRTPERGT